MRTPHTRTIRLFAALALGLTVFIGSHFALAGENGPAAKEKSNTCAAKKQACEKKAPRRFGLVIGVKEEKLKYYNKLHANPWPSINQALRDSNISNYSIYLTQMDDGKWYLFAYYEYTGEDYEADMKKIAENKEVQRWWKETDPCQIPLENRKEGEWWKAMKEVYRLEE